MKIANIEKEKDNYSVYVVTLEPNWFQKIFGVKQKTVRLKDNGSRYMMSGITDYIASNGYSIGQNYIAIEVDAWRKKF